MVVGAGQRMPPTWELVSVPQVSSIIFVSVCFLSYLLCFFGQASASCHTIRHALFFTLMHC